MDIPAWSKPGTKRVFLPSMRLLGENESPKGNGKIKDKPADQAVLDGDGQSMADVQTSGDIGRRTGNDKRIPFIVDLVCVGWGDVFGFEETLSRPPVVPCGFDGDGVVACCHGLCHVCSRW